MCEYCESSLHSIFACPKAKADGVDPIDFLNQLAKKAQPEIIEDPPEVAEVYALQEQSGGG